MYWIIVSILLLIVVFRVYLFVTEQHVHYYDQNLIDGKSPMWRGGRCWWYLSPNDKKPLRYPPPTFNPSWSFFTPCCTHVGFDIAGDEHDFNFYIGIDRMFSIHLILKGIPLFYKLFKDVREGSGYETSLRWSDGALYVHVIHNDTWGAGTFDRWWIPRWIHVWTSGKYKDRGGVGFYVTFLFDNLILGSRQFEKVELWAEPVTAEIPIEPDNTLGHHYFGTFMAERHIRWRKHFPMFKRVENYIAIDVKDPPLHSGKGENSYDLDDDGIFGMHVAGTTLQEAIDGYRKAVRRDRMKYGAPSWFHGEWKSTFQL